MIVKRIPAAVLTLVATFASLVGCDSQTITDHLDQVTQTATTTAQPAEKAGAVATPDTAQLTSPLDVVRVIDGDTIVVSIGGTEETVRIIGIDTPETKKPGTKVQPFGPEATAHLNAMLNNSQVRLEFDPSQGERDKYGRMLAHVWTTDNSTDNNPVQLIGYAQLQNGLAKEYTYRTAYRYQDLYRDTEQRAKEQSTGLWSNQPLSGIAR